MDIYFFVTGQRNTKRHIIFHKEVHIYIYIYKYMIPFKPGNLMNILGSRCNETLTFCRGYRR